MAADSLPIPRIPCINEPLCFITRKFGRYGIKQLKSLLFDFYSGDVLANAKDVLAGAVASLKIDGCPKLAGRRRRESKDNPEAKIRADIDDIISVVVYLDENKVIDQLPVFVAADPDLIPSLRIQEGDMLVVLNKLAAIEERCAGMQREMESMRSVIVRGPSSDRPAASGAAKHPERRIGASVLVATNLPSVLRRPDRVLESEISSAIDSEGGMETDGERFTLAESRSGRRNRAKRQRSSDSPTSPTYASTVGQNQQGATASAAKKQPPSVSTKVRPAAQRKPVMIGHSTTSSMRAAKSLNLPKAVYRIGNIDACYSATDVQQYVESLGVRVVSCFERTSEKSRFADNKTFRICIYDADKKELLSDSNWFVGISIQRWVFKPKAVDQEGVGGMDRSASGGVDTGGVDTREKVIAAEAGSVVAETIDHRNGVRNH